MTGMMIGMGTMVEGREVTEIKRFTKPKGKLETTTTH